MPTPEVPRPGGGVRETDSDYFARRAREEAAAAETAATPQAASIHRRLAAKYAELAETFAPKG